MSEQKWQHAKEGGRADKKPTKLGTGGKEMDPILSRLKREKKKRNRTRKLKETKL